MTVKSIFVPESYLREEIRVGYDQAGGDEAAEDGSPEEVSPVVFKPVEPEEPADPEETDEADNEPAADDAVDPDLGPSAFLPDAVDPEDLEDLEGGADLEPVTTEIFDGLKFDALDDLGEPQQTVASGGGLFGNDFTTVLQTLMVSGNNMPVADILEDGVYELNAIKSYLDSIAQSLAKIADKYAGDSYGNNKRDRQDRQDRQGNKPWNNDRGNKGNKQSWNDRGQDRQDDADAEALIEDGLDE